MTRPFTVSIQKEDDWYVAKCLENSVASQGKTMDEAMENLKEALMLYFCPDHAQCKCSIRV